MTNMKWMLFVVGFLALTPVCPAANQITVKATNKLQRARRSETIELSARNLTSLGDDLTVLHVKDAAGKELLTQALDTDFDAVRKPDTLIFQADFGPGETKIFTVTAGAKLVYTKDQFKAHGRFVRERFDDFAWENDRIAHRTYGKALETWAGEPLTSSTIDIWSKKTPRMVIDEWYAMDNYAGTGGNYHADHGEGFDDYSAGPSRGDGGNGLWANDELWVSKNFVNSRVLANGPIRVLFELVYEPFDVNGTMVSEVKRVSLDAGSQLDHYQSFYKPEGAATLTTAIGLKKVRGEVKESNPARGWIIKWEPMEKNAGMQGLAIIADPKLWEKEAQDDRNLLVVAKTSNNVADYWAGFCWDKFGNITTAADWKKYVDEFAQGLQSPIEVSVSAE